MWDRKELKARGKAAMKANYWRSVLVSLILSILAAGTTASSFTSSNNATKEMEESTNELTQSIESMDSQSVAILAAAVSGAILFIVVVSILLDIFLPRRVLAVLRLDQILKLGEHGAGRVAGKVQKRQLLQTVDLHGVSSVRLRFRAQGKALRPEE